MSERRVRAFVESLRRNRRPKRFEAKPEDADEMRAAIEHFFATYKLLEEKSGDVHGWADRKAALAVLKEDRQRWLPNERLRRFLSLS